MGPWDFDEAREWARQASALQAASNKQIPEAYKDAAIKGEAFYVARSQKMYELNAAGIAWTACKSLAEGDKDVARLKKAYEIAQGVREGAIHAGWKASKDRDDTSRFIDWSSRREIAEMR
jgi:hypothetical protein